jgi:hypothetical protein
LAKRETETQSGECPNHGRVEATREIPGLQFPFIYYGFARMLARRRPFKCPTCESPVKSETTR